MITTYSELKDEIASWLTRSDLDDRIPTFIQLAEKEIARRLRRTAARATFSITGESTQLPVDVAELRSIRLSTSLPQLDRSIRIGTKEMVDDVRATHSNVSGRPIVACLNGRNLIVAPTPDQTYDADITYYSKLTPLSDTVASNSVLVEAPDIYLYGALKHAAPFLEHDERIPTWSSAFESALEQLHLLREREEYNASLRPMRLPIVFG